MDYYLNRRITDLLTFEPGFSTGFGLYYYESHEEYYFGGPKGCVLVGKKHLALAVEYMQLLGMKKELKFHYDPGYWEKGFSTRARFDIGMHIYF